MRANMTKTVVLILSIFAFALMLPFTAQARVKQAAPDFTLADLGGKQVSLKDFRGKVVFLDFWASWCPPCKKELPEIDKLVERYRNAGLAAVAISIDKKKEHAEEFAALYPGLSKRLILLHDPEATVINKYNAKAMPTSFIIDRKGIIRHIHFGYNEGDPQSWVKEIDALLKE